MREIKDGVVDGKEQIWKYFRLERFISTLSDSRIYFASASQFVDPFEGAVAVQVNVPPPDPRYAEMESEERAFFELKRLTKISCWHRAAYESDAMWKLYAGEHKGIAVCTTPERIKAAFKPFRLRPDYGIEDLWAGPVQYVDLTQVRMRGAGMRIFSSAEYCRRVWRRMSFSTCSAGALPGTDFCFIFAPYGYDEPEILTP